MKKSIDTKTALMLLDYLRAKRLIGFHEPENKVFRSLKRFMNEERI